MTIRVADINVHLNPPPVSGTMRLHDDETHTIVFVEIHPVDGPPHFAVDLPGGTTVRDDFDDYKREAERTLQSLLTLTAQEVSDRDRHVGRLERQYRMTDPDRDDRWQQTRWRFISGDAGDIELETAALAHAEPDPLPRTGDPSPDRACDHGKNGDL